MYQYRNSLLSASIFSVSSALFLVACSNLQTSSSLPILSPAQPAALKTCEALIAQFKFASTELESAKMIPAGKLPTSVAPNAPLTAYSVGEHCLVTGKMHARKGIGNQDFAIRFEMRMPKDWNGRFYYQANGGIDGVVQVALGALGGGPITGALAQGFAVISSDAGHTARQNPRFGEDPIARADYGYAAVGKLTPMAKALIAAAYGKAPDRSYIGGCSNGGRHALVAASRYQSDYDGFLVGAPGYRLPNAALQQMASLPGWQALAEPGATRPHPNNPNARIVDLTSAFTPQERQMLANAILDKCDALDGAKDGLIQNTAACQTAFNLERDVKTCSGARDGCCLSAEQKKQIAAVHAGSKTKAGSVIYSTFPYDSGISSANWAQWKFVNSQTLDPAAGYIFMTPPRSIPDPFKLNVDEAYAAIYARNDQFPESANTVITPPGKFDPEILTPLKNRGAKILLYHGVSDAIFSADDTAAWVNRVIATHGKSAHDFVRYFPIPGLAHCGAGGPAVDQMDALTPLVNWVESGIAPERIIASARGPGNPGGENRELPKDWSPTRTRPLCPYPKIAMYSGSGSLEEAASFVCK